MDTVTRARNLEQRTVSILIDQDMGWWEAGMQQMTAMYSEEGFDPEPPLTPSSPCVLGNITGNCERTWPRHTLAVSTKYLLQSPKSKCVMTQRFFNHSIKKKKQPATAAVSSLAELGQSIRGSQSHATHQQKSGSPCPWLRCFQSLWKVTRALDTGQLLSHPLHCLFEQTQLPEKRSICHLLRNCLSAYLQTHILSLLITSCKHNTQLKQSQFILTLTQTNACFTLQSTS